jgi:hypothetical protein
VAGFIEVLQVGPQLVEEFAGKAVAHNLSQVKRTAQLALHRRGSSPRTPRRSWDRQTALFEATMIPLRRREKSSRFGGIEQLHCSCPLSMQLLEFS